jgi:putative ubiquitin-RnfH superfamily antitoxin RatB of RatAB toxin-antitoxin module
MDTPVEIHLYGKLRKYAPDSRADRENVLQVALDSGATIRTALEHASIAEDEVCHIFLNGALFSTHNSMAPWLGYRQAQPNVHQREADVLLKPGDRLGIFGHDMAALVV